MTYEEKSGIVISQLRADRDRLQDALDKIRAVITEYGSIWVEYKITGRRDKDIEQIVSDVLKQAKEQVLDVIDKYKAESEGEQDV